MEPTVKIYMWEVYEYLTPQKILPLKFNAFSERFHILDITHTAPECKGYNLTAIELTKEGVNIYLSKSQ